MQIAANHIHQCPLVRHKASHGVCVWSVEESVKLINIVKKTIRFYGKPTINYMIGKGQGTQP